MIDVCLLGCGGMVPLPDRSLTALLYKYNGKMILIDCGEGTQVSIRRMGWGFKAIEAICITHYHGDHIAGLPGLLMTMGNSGRTEPVTILGPPPLADVVRALTIIAPELPFQVILKELPVEAAACWKIGEIMINSTPGEHLIPSLAYNLQINRAGKFLVENAIAYEIPVKYWSKLQRGETIVHQDKKYIPEMVLGEPREGIKITYITDTRQTDSLIPFAKDSDLLICEGMYGDDSLIGKARERGHMVFSDAAKLARESNSKELWLTHYSPSLGHPEDFLETAAKIFSNTKCGEDRMWRHISYHSEKELS
ncbi:ribonuclease Z [Sinanaerobacter chloroacetimidivorans]|uniref:Ribonuclease Z n=1 Tax=Sinanaerobacter chloroacetimidivorans TaxID=2818044 RepID=A0A8J8B1R3_9FIRM|nr:ribonuclease Z [Sinanaerobacter chloroacetimidivorans]MBR0596515.1 ribonuclease Z [Sinanaerobacter chloroacetimidivorans]